MADRALKPGDLLKAGDALCVLVPVEDYRRLVTGTEADDMIVRCNTCGAWLDRDEEACAHIEDFEGCWKAATGREQDTHLCRSYRALELPAPPPDTGRGQTPSHETGGGERG